MIKYLMSVLFLFHVAQIPGFVISDSGSTVKFKIKNLGVTVTGSLSGLKGKASFDPANLGQSSIESTVDVGTINTGIDLRDDHLKK